MCRRYFHPPTACSQDKACFLAAGNAGAPLSPSSHPENSIHQGDTHLHRRLACEQCPRGRPTEILGCTVGYKAGAKNDLEEPPHIAPGPTQASWSPRCPFYKALQSQGQRGEKPGEAQVMVPCDPPGDCHQRRGCHDKSRNGGQGHISLSLLRIELKSGSNVVSFPLLFPLISSIHFSLPPKSFFFTQRECGFYLFTIKLFPSYRSWHDS